MKYFIAIVALLAIATSVAAQTRAANLALYLTMDSLTPEDSSPAKRAVTISGSENVLAAGKVGSAIIFNSVGAQDGRIDAGIFDVSGNLTVTAWVQVSGLTGGSPHYMKILSTKNSFDAGQGFEIQFVPETGIFSLTGSGSAMVKSKENMLTLDTWYHVAMVAGGATGAIYLNGVDITGPTNTFTPIVANLTRNLLIGSSLAKPASGGEWYGPLDEVRIYNVALTAQEVAAVYAEASASTDGSSTVDTNSATVTVTATVSTVATATDVPTTQPTDNTDVLPTQNTNPTTNTVTVTPSDTSDMDSSAVKMTAVSAVVFALIAALF